MVASDRRSVSVHEWNHGMCCAASAELTAAHFAFNTTPAAVVRLPGEVLVENVVAADLNYDGRVDVLVMAMQPGQERRGPLRLLHYASRPDGSLAGVPEELPPSALAQPLTVDASGQQRTELLGHADATPATLSVWRNWHGLNGTQNMTVEPVRLVSRGAAPPACRLAHPHGSAFVDMNGDCLADLFLVCEEDAGRTSYQIWTAQRDAPRTFAYARSGMLPEGSGALSFADMNRDGTIDVVFPSCDRHGACHINIGYNRQVPLCSLEKEGLFGAWRHGRGSERDAARRCRDPQHLCDADDQFELNLDVSPGNPLLARIHVRDATGDPKLLLRDDAAPQTQPVAVRLGDYNMDGYPDAVVLTVPERARPLETRVHLLESVACTAGAPGCAAGDEAALRRALRRVPHTVLDTYKQVRGVSFVDIDEDGTLDLLLHSAKAGQPRRSADREVAFVQNNVFHDAFFLKALTLNAACYTRCEPEGLPPYGPWGSHHGGVSYRFLVLDPNGIRRAQQVVQQAQTAYGSLLTPGALFGLGRTNNYVEALFVGSTRRQRQPYLAMEGVIPNSELVVIPWQAPAESSPDAWRRELFLHPADWIHLVTAALVGLTALLALVVFFLGLHERREDERERKRAVHAINFDAL